MSQIIDSDRAQAALSRVAADAETGCWNWTGALNHGGYGVVSALVAPGHRRQFRVHRLMYEIRVGPIPPGLEIDHLCSNRRCCNPAHLEAVTQAENVRRSSERLTHCKNGHPRSDGNVRIRISAKGVWRKVCMACARENALARYHATKQLKGRPPLKTRCIRGHELTEANIVRFGRSRHCKACARERYAEKKRRAPDAAD